MNHRTKKLSVVAASVLFALAATACGGGQDALDEGDSGGGGGGGNTIVVGSANFPEQLLLGNMYADVVEGTGAEVELRLNLGSRDVLFPSLENGEITLVPEYNGALLSYLTDGESDVTDPAATTEQVAQELPDGLVAFEASDAQNKGALAVTQETAEEYDLQQISDLTDVAGDLTLGGPPEMETRPDGVPGLQEVYGIEFGEFRALDAGGPLTAEALTSGDIDVGRVFTSQGIIEDRGWVVLEDDQALDPAQNILPIIREDAVNDDIESALNELSSNLTTDDLKALNQRVEVDRDDPEVVAEEYLREKGLIE